MKIPLVVNDNVPAGRAWLVTDSPRGSASSQVLQFGLDSDRLQVLSAAATVASESMGQLTASILVAGEDIGTIARNVKGAEIAGSIIFDDVLLPDLVGNGDGFGFTVGQFKMMVGGSAQDRFNAELSEGWIPVVANAEAADLIGPAYAEEQAEDDVLDGGPPAGQIADMIWDEPRVDNTDDDGMVAAIAAMIRRREVSPASIQTRILRQLAERFPDEFDYRPDTMTFEVRRERKYTPQGTIRSIEVYAFGEEEPLNFQQLLQQSRDGIVQAYGMQPSIVGTIEEDKTDYRRGLTQEHPLCRTLCRRLV